MKYDVLSKEKHRTHKQANKSIKELKIHYLKNTKYIGQIKIENA